ncbi:MAG: hypothetical protein LC641_09715, partial [Spirochaeta sp.]|nr:hypothetical protein [Spirochaeta sp.]
MKKLLIQFSIKPNLFAIAVLLAMYVVMPASASETRVVPREVYPAPLRSESGIETALATTDEQNAFLGILSELVFLQAAVSEPLLRSASAEQADSVIRTELFSAPQAEPDALATGTDPGRLTHVSVLLLHGTEEVERVNRPLAASGLSFSEVQELVQEATRAFTPHLGPIERSLAEAEIVQRSRREEVEQILSLEDRLDSRFLLT